MYTILKIVLEEYKTRGNEFLVQVFETTKYLEDLTGITDLVNQDHEVRVEQA